MSFNVYLLNIADRRNSGERRRLGPAREGRALAAAAVDQSVPERQVPRHAATQYCRAFLV